MRCAVLARGRVRAAMEPRTHRRIDARLCGTPVELAEGRAVVELVTQPEMAADERGLVHGSFPFGAADYAAMLAVNEPTVVLGSATCRFLKAVVVGERIRADATITKTEGKKRTVAVTVRRGDEAVLECEILAIVPDRHVLEPR